MQTNYKSSHFNILFEENGFCLLFNTLRGTFLQLEKNVHHKILFLGNSFLWNKKSHMSCNGELNKLAQKIKQALIEGGMVVPYDWNELVYLKFQNCSHRFSNHTLNLAIAPTLNCNMRCAYCFEKRRSISMQTETCDDISKFAKNYLANGTKSIFVTWYGGEPLLSCKQISYISLNLKKLCEKYETRYEATIITNGVLLDRKMAKDLQNFGINSAQITIDGHAEIHDKRRPLKNNKPSYKRIINNITNVCEILDITIRCNVDKSNVGSAKKFIGELANYGLSKKISLYFAAVEEHVNSNTNRCKDIETCNAVLSQREFAEYQLELDKYAVEMGFKKDKLPIRRFNSCSANELNSYVIEPDGGIQKCWANVGIDSERIGSVKNGIVLDSVALKWFEYSPLDSKKCRLCKILPICMGWCPRRVSKDSSLESCHTHRFNILDRLRNYYYNNKINSAINQQQ